MQPTHAEMIDNILRVYGSATETERTEGKNWYPRAHSIVCDWAETFERSIANVACVVAAISVQCEWERNLIIADDILRGDEPSIGGAIHRFVEIAKQVRIERAWSLDGYFKVGCKVRSFAANLAGDYSVVTVDTHAAQIANGSILGNLRVDTWKRYTPVANAYVDAAKRVGVKPAELQAITWLVWKQLHPTAIKRVARRRSK